MNAYRETAEIIQFPMGGRAGIERRNVQTAEEHNFAPRVQIASGGAWYHEEAIQDADRAQNH